MNRWFRHYVGLCADPKFGGVARRAKVARDRVVFVFCFLLESATERNDGGAYDWDADAVADLLNCETAEIDRVYAELQASGMLSEDRIAKWSSRQYEGDKDPTNAERQRRHRQRQAQAAAAPAVTEAGVTGVTGVTNAPQRTDTDTDTEIEAASAASRARGHEADFRAGIAAVYARRGLLPPETGLAVVWLKQGRDPAICLAVIDDHLARQRRTLPLKYFDGPIADAHAAPTAARPPARASPPARRNGWAEIYRRGHGLGEFANAGAFENPEAGAADAVAVAARGRD